MNFALKHAIPEPDRGSRPRPDAKLQSRRGTTWASLDKPILQRTRIRNFWAERGLISGPRLEVTMVDKDRIKGSAEQAKGKVKEVAGKVTGDSKLEGEGKADQVKGKVQNTIGGIKDTLRGK
jgi:uncharacterized protein YjbJ (UPF0337 family)